MFARGGGTDAWARADRRAAGATSSYAAVAEAIRVVSPAVRFVVVGAVLEVETIAQGRGIRELARLRRLHGLGRWRKRKGIAKIRFDDGTTCTAELHWYEAHGVGRKELKIKRLIS